MFKLLCTQFLEKGFNKIITLDPSHRHFLSKHIGKVLRLQLNDLHLNLFFILRDESISISSFYENTADTVVKTTTLGLCALMVSAKAQNQLDMEGDIYLAQDMFYFLKNLNFNVEEGLSWLLGDMGADSIFRFTHSLKQNIVRIKSRTKVDTIDYFQHEKNILPNQEEVEDFFEDIANLGLDLDRLEARLARLKDRETK